MTSAPTTRGPALGETDDPTGENEAYTLTESNPFNLDNPTILEIAPAEPKSLADTGLKMGLLSDIVLKYLYYSGNATGLHLADELRLPWPNVVEKIIDYCTAEKLTDLRGGKGFGRVSVEFVLTEKGREHARDALVDPAVSVSGPDAGLGEV